MLTHHLMSGIAAAGSGVVSVPFGSLFVAAGDSITDNGAAESSSIANGNGRGYWQWVMQGARGRIMPVYQADAGVTGNQTGDLWARYAADVTSKNPKIVLLLIGTNDVINGRTADYILGYIDLMLAANRAIGAVTVMGRILPRGSVGSPMNGSQITAWEGANAGISARAAPDIKVWDVEAIIGNMDAAHTMKTGYSDSGDFLHPNTRCGYEIAVNGPLPIINSLIASGDNLFTTNNAAGNLIPNGFMTGTGGVNVGTTGQLATGWVGDTSQTGGALMAVSKAARGDGYGEWQQFAMSGTYTGSGRAGLIYAANTFSVLAGQRIRLSADFEIDAGHLQFAAMGVRAVVGPYSIESLVAFGGETAEVNGSGAISGIIRTMPFQLSANQTAFAIYIRPQLLDVGSLTACSVVGRIGRLELKVV